ncbi:IncF plasmid conjugative transfer pilus assembly protein TraC [Candidatus Burkholderia pumila]|uniref:IncF plasmid conjugative transfer pilus assembly protein TraC n=1 Tax=Candidatus Burkholderia pumila TaxID=1090375 RepID=A0ABR5HPK7_9BURK|nr:IncF plasmid conjugative transfer pilus assembly protein TraC [Candidatus Burkholderia pumila]
MVQVQLDAGGQMCELYHTLVLFAPRQQINQYSQTAINLWDNIGFRIVPLRMLNLQALYASLPMTLTKGARGDLKRNRLMSQKTTVNAVDIHVARARRVGWQRQSQLCCSTVGAARLRRLTFIATVRATTTCMHPACQVLARP